MKRFYFLFVLLLLTTILTNAQTPRQDDSTKYIWYQNQYGLRQPRIASDSFFLPPYGDTTGRRPYRNGALMMHTDGKYYKWNIGSGWNLASGTSTLALDWVNVVSFGADSTGATNSTTAIQNAFNSLNGGRPKVVYFPSGTYLTTGNIHVPSCRIIGVSGTNAMGFDAPQGNRTFKFDGTKILCTSATNNLFIFDSSGTVIEHCALVNTSGATPTAGAGIKSMKPSTKILHCAISGFYDNVWFDESPEYLVDDVFFSQYVRYGIYHRTFIEPDAGDQNITNSWFYPRNYNAAAAIHIESGGGIKMSNLKFNANSLDTLGIDCIQLVMDNITTSDLLVSNCSFENYSGKGISIKVKNSGNFYHTVISGNQFAPNSANADGIFVDGSGGNIRDIAITGNAFGNADTAIYFNSIASPSLVGNIFDVVNSDVITVNTNEFVQMNYTKALVNPNPINIQRSLSDNLYNVLKNISTNSFAKTGYRFSNSTDYLDIGIGSSANNGSSAYFNTSALGSNIKFAPNLTEALWINKDTTRISTPFGLLLRNGAETSSFQNIQGSIQTSANAHYNGSTWERFNTSLPSWNLNVDPNSNAFAVRHSAAGSGTITWTERFKVDNSGVVTIANLSGTGTRMVVTGSGGSLSAQDIPVNTNFANSDLRFTGNRFHVAAGNNLTIDSLKDYKLFSKGSFFGTPVRSSYQVLPNTPSSGLLITYAFSKTDLSGDSVSVYLSGNPNTIDLGASDISNGHNSVVRVSNSGTGKSNIMLQTDSLSASMQPRSTYDSLVVVGTYNSGTKTNPIGKASLSDVRGYKTYVANLSQSGTSDPTAVVLGGNQIGTIVWTRTGLGSYTGVLSGAFISGKTVILSGQNADGITANCFRSDVNTVTLKTYLTFNGGSTDVFSDLSIEIRVYP
jgi:hypothetical protein